MKNRRTMIIAAFPACGKTYLSRQQDELRFETIYGERRFTFADLDSGGVSKDSDWYVRYVDTMLSLVGQVDFILIGQRELVLKELSKRGIKYVTVTPDNSMGIPYKERQLIKNQWFGRFLLRDNSHIDNFNEWLKKFRDGYDTWTTPEFINQFTPSATYVLKQDEYLIDIIADMYRDKETIDRLVQEVQS